MGIQKLALAALALTSRAFSPSLNGKHRKHGLSVYHQRHQRYASVSSENDSPSEEGDKFYESLYNRAKELGINKDALLYLYSIREKNPDLPPHVLESISRVLERKTAEEKAGQVAKALPGIQFRNFDACIDYLKLAYPQKALDEIQAYCKQLFNSGN
ncbi:MAG: hypothetical protein AAGI66_02080 [Cyanobacteria bacterium P01_H01_bin.74]